MGDCEYCANTRIDGLTLKRMGIELPCRYCEVGIQDEPSVMDALNLTDEQLPNREPEE